MPLPAIVNATQAIGMAAFATSALACLCAARTPAAGWHRGWLALAAMHAWYSLDIWLDTRHHTHLAANTWLLAHGLYLGRGSIQVGLLVAVAVLATAALAWVALRSRPRGISLSFMVAGIGTAVAALVYASELISHHDIDTLLYAHVGAWPVIVPIWLLSTLPVAIAAITTTRRIRLDHDAQRLP